MKNILEWHRLILAFVGISLTAGLPFGGEAATNEPITFTYDITTGRCVASRGKCNDLPVHAICSTDPTFSQIAQNDAALRAFNAEAQRHTRPAEPGYPGGNYIIGPRYPVKGAGDAYPDADINNIVVLRIPACNKLQYTWNSFTMLVRNIQIVGAGSTGTVLQNVNKQDFHSDVAGRANFDFFGDTFYGVINDIYPTDSYGYLTENAQKGTTAVTLKSPRDLKNFNIGRWVLVMSYIQDSIGSYPPNMRYYDFAKVATVDAASGTIHLDTPLAFDHLATRPFDGEVLHPAPSIRGNNIGVGIVGPARIVDIDTPVKPIAETFTLSGIHFLRNPRSSFVTEYNDGWEFTGIIDAMADDLVFDGSINTAEMRNFTLSNSSAFYEEADKIVSKAIYINNRFVNSLLHSGQLLWHATGGRYGGDGEGEVSCAALNCVIDGGAVLSSAQRATGPHPGIELDRVGFTNSVSLDDVTFTGKGALGNAAINAWQGTPYTIGTPGISLRSGPYGENTRITISKCLATPDCTDMQIGRTAAQEVTSNWSEGSTLIRNGDLVPGATVASITGDARSVYMDLQGASLSSGDTVYFSRVNHLSVRNSTFNGIGNSCDASVGPTGCVRFPGRNNIPDIIWIQNSGG